MNLNWFLMSGFSTVKVIKSSTSDIVHIHTVDNIWISICEIQREGRHPRDTDFCIGSSGREITRTIQHPCTKNYYITIIIIIMYMYRA